MAPARTADDSGRKAVPPKKILDTIRDATGASDEDITAMLVECNYDVNEATTRLIESGCFFSLGLGSVDVADRRSGFLLLI
jgi:hypothetical protein